MSTEMSLPDRPLMLAHMAITEEESKLEHSLPQTESPQPPPPHHAEPIHVEISFNQPIKDMVREAVSIAATSGANLKKIQRDFAIAVAGSRDDIPSSVEQEPQSGREWEAMGFARKKITDSQIFGPANARAHVLETEISKELELQQESKSNLSENLKKEYQEKAEARRALNFQKQELLQEVHRLNAELDSMLNQRKAEELRLSEKLREHSGLNEFQQQEYEQFVEAMTEQYKEAIEVLENQYMTTEDWRAHAVSQKIRLEQVRKQEDQMAQKVKEKRELIDREKALDLELSLAKETLTQVSDKIFPIMAEEKAIQQEIIDQNLARLSMALAGCKEQLNRHDQQAKINFSELYGTERISK